MVAQLFESAVVSHMLDQHRHGSCNFTRELRGMAALALWHQETFV